MEFRKAHGTGNDFIVLPDEHGRLDLSDAFVARLCDRRFGLGADGVLRVVRTAAAGEEVPDSVGCEWFMDYRNADGSAAQMCGNGARVFVGYLWDSGLAPSGRLRFATRGGARTATARGGGEVCIDMGPAVVGEPGGVLVSAGEGRWPATAVHVPNPHAVAFVDGLGDPGPLVEIPRLEPAGAFPDGANVEFVVVRGEHHIAMRVHERGVGETLSCGTGACAAAAAYLRTRTDVTAAVVRVDVPGGTLSVGIRADSTVTLTGPTQTVAEGRIDTSWLQAAR
jgi:diaminopimelate epimerase